MFVQHLRVYFRVVLAILYCLGNLDCGFGNLKVLPASFLILQMSYFSEVLFENSTTYLNVVSNNVRLHKKFWIV